MTSRNRNRRKEMRQARAQMKRSYNYYLGLDLAGGKDMTAIAVPDGERWKPFTLTDFQAEALKKLEWSVKNAKPVRFVSMYPRRNGTDQLMSVYIALCKDAGIEVLNTSNIKPVAGELRVLPL